MLFVGVESLQRGGVSLTQQAARRAAVVAIRLTQYSAHSSDARAIAAQNMIATVGDACRRW